MQKNDARMERCKNNAGMKGWKIELRKRKDGKITQGWKRCKKQGENRKLRNSAEMEMWKKKAKNLKDAKIVQKLTDAKKKVEG